MSTSVASVVSHFPSAENGFTTTTSGSVASGATTVGLNSVAGYANGEVVALVIDPSDATKKQTFTGTIDTAGVQVTNVVWTAGTNTTHASGATVVDYPTATHISMMTKGILKFATQAGLIDSQGVASFQTHIDVNDSSTAIRDSSDNELIKFAKTNSAVNEVTFTNAATANAPQIGATGGDSNIDLRLVPKGTGNVKRGATGGSIDWWEEIGRQTLGSAGDTISLTSLPARKYLKLMWVLIPTGGALNSFVRFNNDSGSNYSSRLSANGGADTAPVSQSANYIDTSGAADDFHYGFMEIINIAGQEKINISQSTRSGGSGAGNAPLRREQVQKWANTAAQISRIDVINGDAGDFAIGSEVVVLGHD